MVTKMRTSSGVVREPESDDCTIISGSVPRKSGPIRFNGYNVVLLNRYHRFNHHGLRLDNT